VFRFVPHTVKPLIAELLLLAALPWLMRYKNDYFHKKCNSLGNPGQTLIAFSANFDQVDQKINLTIFNSLK
jgi:hypothetical protein